MASLFHIHKHLYQLCILRNPRHRGSLHLGRACIRHLSRFLLSAFVLGRWSLAKLLLFHEARLWADGEKIPWKARLAAIENRAEQEWPFLLLPIPTISSCRAERLPQHGIRLRRGPIQDIFLFESNRPTPIHFPVYQVGHDARSTDLRRSAWLLCK